MTPEADQEETLDSLRERFLVAKKWEIRNAVASQVGIPEDGLEVIDDLKDLIGTRLEMEFLGEDRYSSRW